jgi:presenilin-like A22 family membrane protease
LLDKSNEWVRETFLNLPIVIYYGKEGKFSMSETSFEGYTIGGRLKIVYEGEGTMAMSSCLRLSSNWFLSTVCYYQKEFGFESSFDVTRLVHIG